MFREEKITGSFITGLVTGSVIGGVTALLFAPKSGKELRKDISDKSTELYDDANHLLNKAQELSSSIIGEPLKRAENMLEEGKEKVESYVKDAGDFFIHGKEMAENEVSVVKEAVKSGVDSYNDERNKYKSNN